jgi:hypothetical protein
MAVKIWNVFWVMGPCSLVRGYQHFGRTYGLHLMSRNLRLHVVVKCTTYRLTEPCLYEYTDV